MFAPARHPIRFLWRSVSLAAVFIAMPAWFLFRVAVHRRRLTLSERTAWIQQFSRCLLRAFAVRVESSGTPPRAGLVVCNHLSYLDIPVLASVRTAVFVSKADVKGWPVIGWCTRRAGTLFIQRENRADVGRIANEMSRVLNGGVVLVLFPEGTSSGGDTVLPFRSSLLEPAARQNFPVTPAALNYSLADGDAAREVCYWRDLKMFPHLINLLTKREIRVYVAFGETRVRQADRKELARQLHTEVLALKKAVSAPP